MKDFVRKADKAFLVTFFGAVVMLLGFIQIYGQTNTFDLTAMRGTVIPGTAVLLILFGMFSKSATVPLHTWLPDAGVAPTTVTALLHAAVLVKIGVYAYARIFLYTFQLPGDWPQVIPIVVVVSSLIAAAAATVENDFKRILAYSTVSQIGYIFLGFSMANEAGISGSLLFILMHGLAKAGLFLCAGIVIHATHKRDIREMGGLIKTMPVTAIAFLFCAFSVIGIPPFGGFFSKFLVIMGTVKAGQVWLAAVALFTAVLTMFYLLEGVQPGLPGRGQSARARKRPNPWSSSSPSSPSCRSSRASSSPIPRSWPRSRRPISDGGSNDAQHASLADPSARPRRRRLLSHPRSGSSSLREAIALLGSVAVLYLGLRPVRGEEPRAPPALDGHGHQLRAAPVPFLGLHPPRPRPASCS